MRRKRVSIRILLPSSTLEKYLPDQNQREKLFVCHNPINPWNNCQLQSFFLKVWLHKCKVHCCFTFCAPIQRFLQTDQRRLFPLCICRPCLLKMPVMLQTAFLMIFRCAVRVHLVLDYVYSDHNQDYLGVWWCAVYITLAHFKRQDLHMYIDLPWRPLI